jgi:hypothetical protein
MINLQSPYRRRQSRLCSRWCEEEYTTTEGLLPIKQLKSQRNRQSKNTNNQSIELRSALHYLTCRTFEKPPNRMVDDWKIGCAGNPYSSTLDHRKQGVPLIGLFVAAAFSSSLCFLPLCVTANGIVKSESSQSLDLSMIQKTERKCRSSPNYSH